MRFLDNNSLFDRRVLIAAGALALAVPLVATAGPVAIPHQFVDGEVVSAQDFNDNFGALSEAVNDNDARLAVVEAAAPTVTIRKSTGSYERAIAFCEADEVLMGGGCFVPPENLYDSDYDDYDTYHTGNFPRPLVGLTSVPVAPGTTLADLRPTTGIGGNIMPFPGDLIADNDGAVASPMGGGWGCRAGIVQHNAAGAAQAITTNFYEGWWFHVKAYAVCMEG